MRTLKRRNLIAPVAYRDLAQALCAAIAGPAGAGMFLRPLYQLPEPPPPPDPESEEEEGGAVVEPQEPMLVAYVSSGRIDAQFADLLPLNGSGGDVAAIVALAQQAGVMAGPAEIADLLDAADITDINPHVRIAQLGYVLG